MRKWLALTVLLLMGSSFLSAGEHKSTGKALLLSALVPGMGQMYLGNHARGGVYMGAELMIMLSHLRLNDEIAWKTNSYMLYAERYAGIPLDSDESYYRFVGSYISSNDYNAGVERYFRNLYIIYRYNPDEYRNNLNRYLVTGEDQWEWQSRDNWIKYRELRREKQEMEILTNFALGASLLNRLVSVIDAAIIARAYKKGGTTSINEPSSFLSDVSIEPDYLRNGINIRYQYRF